MKAATIVPCLDCGWPLAVPSDWPPEVLTRMLCRSCNARHDLYIFTRDLCAEPDHMKSRKD